MKKLILIMTFFGLFIIQFAIAQDKNVKGEKVTTSSVSKKRLLNSAFNCNNNGINITVTGTGGVEYYYPSPISSIVCNSPVVGYSGLGKHSGPGSAAVLTYTFSKAISCATVSYCWVEPDDVGKITTDGGGIVTLSDTCGANISGDVLTSNLIGGNGNVTVKVSSTTPFTKIILTNIGGRTGWGQGNPCNFILNDCKSIKFDNCTSCIPESLYNKDITKTLFSIIPVTATMNNFTYKLQFNSTQDFINLNKNWNNWINALVKPALGSLSRAQELECFGKGGFVQVVHEFRLYDITNGTEIEMPNTVFHIHSGTNYANVNWQPQDHPFNAVLDFNKKYMIKHGVYYESTCLKDNNAIKELIKTCPWKESRLNTNRDIDKSNKNNEQKVFLE